jgi:hypothetical protein
MDTFLFTTAFKRSNGEILPGDVRELEDLAFKFNATESMFYYFVIKKDDWEKKLVLGRWCGVAILHSVALLFNGFFPVNPFYK